MRSLPRVEDNWVYRRAARKYESEGVAGLVRSAPGFLYWEFLRGKPREVLLMSTLAGRVLNREDLKRETGRHGRLWYYGEEEHFRIEGRDDRALPYELAKWIGPYHAERPFVCEVRGGKLVGDEPIGLTGDNRVILETADANRKYLYFKLEDLVGSRGTMGGVRESLRSLRYSNGADGDPDFDLAMPLVKYRATTFYHWMLEYLPKVWGLERYVGATGDEPTVLLQSDPPSWMTESLRLVGLDPSTCVEWTAEEARVSRLVVPMHRKRVMAVPRRPYPDDFNPSIADCRWLRERMRSNLPDGVTNDDSRPSRVYISRRHTEYNRVANEDEITQVLTDAGFVPYVLEDLSVAEQVALFSGVEAIVAPHGSGLVNMIFADDTTVVELFREDNVRGFYFCLARQLGFDYEFLTGRSVDGTMVVDPEQLRSVIDRAV